MKISEADIIAFRDRVAAIFDEDIAQDAVVRILEERPRFDENWQARELWIAKRAWQHERIREARNTQLMDMPGEEGGRAEAHVKVHEMLDDHRVGIIIRYLNGGKTSVAIRKRISRLREELREEYF